MGQPDPHILIGGSRPPDGPASCAGFDAYCATIFAQPDAMFDELMVLLESAGFEPREMEGFKAPYYARSRLVVDEKGHQLLIFKSGGANPHPFVQCTGRASEALGSHLRAFHGHRPSRIDHAVDVCSQGAFEALHAYSKRLCKDYRLKLSYDGDWNSPDAGRTIYIGARSSMVFVRVYEKGLEYAAKLGLPVTAELRQWVRVELEFKPQTREAKDRAAGMEGAHLWGSTRWTQQFAEEVLSMPTETVNLRLRRESNTERAMRFCALHYGRAFRATWSGEHCSPAAGARRLRALGLPETPEAVELARQALFAMELLYRAGILSEDEIEAA